MLTAAQDTFSFPIEIFNGRNRALGAGTKPVVFIQLYTSFMTEFHLLRLKGSAISVFLCLSLFADENGECFPSKTTIMKYTGLSKTAVGDALAQLETIDAGRGRKYVVKIQRKRLEDGGDTSYRYLLLPDPAEVIARRAAGVEYVTRYGLDTPPGTQKVLPPVVIPTPNNNYLNPESFEPVFGGSTSGGHPLQTNGSKKIPEGQALMDLPVPIVPDKAFLRTAARRQEAEAARAESLANRPIPYQPSPLGKEMWELYRTIHGRNPVNGGSYRWMDGMVEEFGEFKVRCAIHLTKKLGKDTTDSMFHALRTMSKEELLKFRPDGSLKPLTEEEKLVKYNATGETINLDKVKWDTDANPAHWRKKIDIFIKNNAYEGQTRDKFETLLAKAEFLAQYSPMKGTN